MMIDHQLLTYNYPPSAPPISYSTTTTYWYTYCPSFLLIHEARLLQVLAKDNVLTGIEHNFHVSCILEGNDDSTDE